jgi:hypothetical protein
LAPPTEIKASVNSDAQLLLNWSPIEGAEGYLVLVSLKPGGEENVGEIHTKEPSLVAELKGGPPWYVVIRSLRGEDQSADSKEIEVTR